MPEPITVSIEEYEAMNPEQKAAAFKAMQQQAAKLKAALASDVRIEITKSGCVGFKAAKPFRGPGVALYVEEWLTIFDAQAQIQEFIDENSEEIAEVEAESKRRKAREKAYR